MPDEPQRMAVVTVVIHRSVCFDLDHYLRPDLHNRRLTLSPMGAEAVRPRMPGPGRRQQLDDRPRLRCFQRHRPAHHLEGLAAIPAYDEDFGVLQCPGHRADDRLDGVPGLVLSEGSILCRALSL